MTLTTKQAAELRGIAPSSFRGEMTRERKRGRDYRAPQDQWRDKRSPEYDEASIREWIEQRKKG